MQHRQRSSALSLYPPVIVHIAHVRAQAEDVLGRVGQHLAVAKVCKSIRVSVPDIVVFEAGVLDALEEVDGLWEQVLVFMMMMLH